MKRRTFCAAGLAALTTASIPFRRAAAGTGGDISAVGLDGRQLTLKAAEVEDLRAGLRGELITADQPAYESARRLWNPAFDRKPAERWRGCWCQSRQFCNKGRTHEVPARLDRRATHRRGSDGG